MQLDTDLTGLTGSMLAILVLLARFPRVRVLPPLRRAGVLAAAVVVVSIPLWGLSLAGFVRGIAGDLSITTLVLLAMALLRAFHDRPLVEERNRLGVLQAIAVAAVLFYPFALGLGMFDPYRLGFGNLWFMVALLALAVWASLRASMLLAVCIALAVAAWSVGWYESTNLWDYLLDPWLAIYAIAALAKHGLARWRSEKHA